MSYESKDVDETKRNVCAISNEYYVKYKEYGLEFYSVLHDEYICCASVDLKQCCRNYGDFSQVTFYTVNVDGIYDSDECKYLLVISDTMYAWIFKICEDEIVEDIKIHSVEYVTIASGVCSDIHKRNCMFLWNSKLAYTHDTTQDSSNIDRVRTSDKFSGLNMNVVLENGKLIVKFVECINFEFEYYYNANDSNVCDCDCYCDYVDYKNQTIVLETDTKDLFI